MAMGVVDQEPSLRLVAASPLYRGATIALFLSGLGASAAAPQIAMFLVDELGSSLAVAGLFYLTSLSAPIAGYLVGSRSDRTGKRLGLFRLCAVAGFIGWLGFALSTELWMPFVISTLVLGFAGAATSQLFAAIHDELSMHPTPQGDGIVAIVRMALTGGWVVGPVAGAMLAAHYGARTMFVATGLCMLAQILPLGTLRTARPARRAALTSGGIDIPGDRGPGLKEMVPLVLFTGLYICVYAGEAIKYAYLPIYMSDDLGFSPSLRGSIIGIQPLVELALIPVAIVVARRTGMMRLMILAAGFGVAANLCFAFTGTAAGLFAGQILMGGVWGVFAALGIIVAQRLLPSAVATASAIFLSSTSLSSAMGGLIGGLGAAAVGLPLVFLVPATFGVIAVIGLWIMSRSGEASM